MKFTLLVVGRTVEKHYITAINDYVERTRHFISFDMEVIPELKNTKNLSMEQQKEKEGELILKALLPGDVVVLLDEHGKEFRSVEFANWIERKMHTVNKRLVYFITRQGLPTATQFFTIRFNIQLFFIHDLLSHPHTFPASPYSSSFQ